MDAADFIIQANMPGGVLDWEQDVMLAFETVMDIIAQQRDAIEAMHKAVMEQDKLLKSMVAVNRKLLARIDDLERE